VVVALHRDRMAVLEHLALALARVLSRTAPRALHPESACDNGCPAYPVPSVEAGIDLDVVAGCATATLAGHASVRVDEEVLRHKIAAPKPIAVLQRAAGVRYPARTSEPPPDHPTTPPAVLTERSGYAGGPLSKAPGRRTPDVSGGDADGRGSVIEGRHDQQQRKSAAVARAGRFTAVALNERSSPQRGAKLEAAFG
jgi:hypothetical protein